MLYVTNFSNCRCLQSNVTHNTILVALHRWSDDAVLVCSKKFQCVSQFWFSLLEWIMLIGVETLSVTTVVLCTVCVCGWSQGNKHYCSLDMLLLVTTVLRAGFMADVLSLIHILTTWNFSNFQMCVSSVCFAAICSTYEYLCQVLFCFSLLFHLLKMSTD